MNKASCETFQLASMPVTAPSDAGAINLGRHHFECFRGHEYYHEGPCCIGTSQLEIAVKKKPSAVENDFQNE